MYRFSLLHTAHYLEIYQNQTQVHRPLYLNWKKKNQK